MAKVGHPIKGMGKLPAPPNFWPLLLALLTLSVQWRFHLSPAVDRLSKKHSKCCSLSIDNHCWQRKLHGCAILNVPTPRRKIDILQQPTDREEMQCRKFSSTVSTVSTLFCVYIPVSLAASFQSMEHLHMHIIAILSSHGLFLLFAIDDCGETAIAFIGDLYWCVHNEKTESQRCRLADLRIHIH